MGERVAMEGTISSRPVFTMAMDFATMAISQLSRIDPPQGLAGAPLTLPFLEAFTRRRKRVALFEGLSVGCA